MGTTTALSSRSLQYYVIATRWAAELEFFGLETPFLYFLMDEYFMRLCDIHCVAKFKRLIHQLSELECEKLQIDIRLKKQIEQITEMAEDLVPENPDSLSQQQIQLEYLVNNMIAKYKSLKLELFALTDTFRKSKSN